MTFPILLSELRKALHAEGLMLTAAVSAGKPTIDAAYEVPALSRVLVGRSDPALLGPLGQAVT